VDLLGDVAVREHGVGGHHLALKRQHPQQTQGGLVLVGLGVHTHLRQHSGRGGDEGAQQVDAGNVAVLGAPEGLAVQGDGLPAGGAAGL
jgi:hypothetical protein